MRRHVFSVGSLGFLCIAALVSCRASVPHRLPPEIVLERTILGNASIESVAYDLAVELRTPTSSGTLLGTGSILNGGSSWSFFGSLLFEDYSYDSHRQLRLHGTVITPQSQPSYLYLEDRDGMLADGLPSGALPLGTWLVLRSSTGSAPGSTSSPSAPSLLSFFSSVRIVRDHGLQKSSDGAYEYRYTLEALSGSGLAGATGNISIDAKLFRLQSVRWSIPLAVSGSHVVVSARLSSYNNAPDLGFVPKSDTSASFDTIFNIIWPKSPLPTPVVSGDTEAHDD